jgi:hypothetical protein
MEVNNTTAIEESKAQCPSYLKLHPPVRLNTLRDKRYSLVLF